MNRRRTPFSLGSCMGYMLLLSCFAITAGEQANNKRLAANVKTQKNALALAEKIDIQATERLYCSRLDCWQKAATCPQHKQTHLRLLPSELLDKIGQFLGAPSNLLHQLDEDSSFIPTYLPAEPSKITISRRKANLFCFTLNNRAAAEYLQHNPDKYPHILCHIESPSSYRKKLDYLSYDPIKNEGYLYSSSSPTEIQDEQSGTTSVTGFDLLVRAVSHLLNKPKQKKGPYYKQAKITSVNDGFLARYVALRQLGIPMQTAQRYNRMESDMPRRVKQPKPERIASRMLGVAAQDEQTS